MTTTPSTALTVREAAARIRRNPETVRRWIWSKKLPARKLGNVLYVQATDLDAIADGTQPSRRTQFDAAAWRDWVSRLDKNRSETGVSIHHSSADLVLEDRDARAGD